MLLFVYVKAEFPKITFTVGSNCSDVTKYLTRFHTIHKVSKAKNSRSIPQCCCLQKELYLGVEQALLTPYSINLRIRYSLEKVQNSVDPISPLFQIDVALELRILSQIH